MTHGRIAFKFSFFGNLFGIAMVSAVFLFPAFGKDPGSFEEGVKAVGTIPQKEIRQGILATDTKSVETREIKTTVTMPNGDQKAMTQYVPVQSMNKSSSMEEKSDMKSAMAAPTGSAGTTGKRKRRLTRLHFRLAEPPRKTQNPPKKP